MKMFGWPHHPLQGQAFPLSAAPKPGSDAACQDALYGAGVESLLYLDGQPEVT